MTALELALAAQQGAADSSEAVLVALYKPYAASKAKLMGVLDKIAHAFSKLPEMRIAKMVRPRVLFSPLALLSCDPLSPCLTLLSVPVSLSSLCFSISVSPSLLHSLAKAGSR